MAKKGLLEAVNERDKEASEVFEVILQRQLSVSELLFPLVTEIEQVDCGQALCYGGASMVK
jgi:hypothetical protein